MAICLMYIFDLILEFKMAICLMYIFDLFYFGIQSLFYMYETFLCEYLYDNIKLQCLKIC
jgi:hypothetical protein